MRRTIVLLEERFPQTRSKVDWSKIKSAIEIGSLTNRSDIKRETLLGELRDFCSLYIRMQDGFALAGSPGGLKDLGDLIQRHGIKPFILMVNVNSLKKRLTGAEAVWEATVSMTLLDYPDSWIRGTLKNSGASSEPMEKYTPQKDDAMQGAALEKAVEAAIDDLAKRLPTL